MGIAATGIDLIDLSVKKPGKWLCPPGQYFPDGLSSCALCEAGSYCLGGDFYSTKCANGDSPPGSTSSAACTCLAGFGGENSKCMQCSRNLCAAGKFTAGCSGNSAGSCEGCLACDAGFYREICMRDVPGVCSACPPDTYALGTGPRVVCSACDAACGEGTFAIGCGGASQGSCQACGDCPVGQYRAGCGVASPGTCVSCAVCEAGQYTAGCSGRSGPGACESCLERTYALDAGVRTGACLPCLECSGVRSVLNACSTTTGPGTCNQCPDGLYSSGGRCVSCCPKLLNRKYETADECLDMAKVDVEGQGPDALFSGRSTLTDRTIVDGCVSGVVSYSAAWTEANGTAEAGRSLNFTCTCTPASCPLGQFPTGDGTCSSCCPEGYKTQDSCESLTAPAMRSTSVLYVGSTMNQVRGADPSGGF